VRRLTDQDDQSSTIALSVRCLTYQMSNRALIKPKPNQNPSQIEKNKIQKKLIDFIGRNHH
jgi:hypothetical protein